MPHPRWIRPLLSQLSTAWMSTYRQWGVRTKDQSTLYYFNNTQVCGIEGYENVYEHVWQDYSAAFSNMVKTRQEVLEMIHEIGQTRPPHYTLISCTSCKEHIKAVCGNQWSRCRGSYDFLVPASVGRSRWICGRVHPEYKCELSCSVTCRRT
jgi:hypothetical protein